jgi:hypothetical protein
LKTWIILALTVITICVYHFTQPKVFSLLFEPSKQDCFYKLNVSEDKIEKEYEFPNDCSETFKRCTIKVNVSNLSGLLDLKVTYKSGKKVTISNVEYYVGEANYISTAVGRLGWVRAHWQ